MDRKYRRKFSKISTIVIVLILFYLNIVFPLLNPTISKKLDISVDFLNGSDDIFHQSCDAINIWDISHVPNNMSEFKEQHPTIDTIVLMTATGGRSSGTNDYVHRDVNGTLVYDFTNLTTNVDKIVDAGLKIEIVIGNIPHALANSTSFSPDDYGAFDALTLPPGNITEYRYYIQNLTSTCVSEYGLDNVSMWEWRLMTEPDNRDWWTGSVEEYIDLWIATFSEIKNLIPNASLVLGNMAFHDDFAFPQAVLNALKEENSTLLPDTVSFSYYHSLENPPPPNDLEYLIEMWSEFVNSLDLNKDIVISCEEGFILHDEDGKRLWLGDGTELGAAWEGWMMTSSRKEKFKRFVQWDTQVDGYLSPRGFVHLMAERMDGMELVDIDIASNLLTYEYLGGIAVRANDSNKFYIMLYNYFPRRNIDLDTTVDLKIKGLASSTYNFSHYRVNKYQHNWFTQWLVDVGSIENNETLFDSIEGSRYDLSVGSRFKHPDAWLYWWNWKQAHSPPSRTLYSYNSFNREIESNFTSFKVNISVNSVELIEIIKC